MAMKESFCPACFCKACSASGLFFSSADYLYFRPHPTFAPYIAHYTLCPPGFAEPRPLTLIPDASGCFVFAFTRKQIIGHFWGPTTQTAVVKHDYAQFPYRFFIEFLPGGAHRLTGFPLHEWVNLRIPLEQLHTPLVSSLYQALFQAKSMEDLLGRVNALFCNALSLREENPLARACLSLLQHTNGQLPAHTAGEILHYSPRHLSRVLRPMLGLSLQQYLRLQRINRALSILETPAESFSFTALAQSLGYYDQSHFIHDFKSVCGTTPTGYLQNMSDFYKETYKF